MTTEMVGEVVPAVENVAALDSMTAQQREAAVTKYLSNARAWLATCVEMTGPESIARVKAEVATAAEATKQLGLSKEIQEDAVEMVRRAEYALGKAIRKGQAEGTVARRGQGGANPPGSKRDRVDSGISLPTEFASSDELSGNQTGIYAISDGVEPDQFDEALGKAKEEHNVSRANLVRKLKGQDSAPAKLPEAKRVEQITELTERARSVAQIAAEIGVTEEHVRVIANRNNIETVDKRLGHGSIRNPKSAEVAGRIISGLKTTAEISIPLVHIADLDPAQCKDWASSLAASIRSLNRFRRQLEGRAQS